MGKTGSSNRPYALSRRDFQHHFDSISLAHRGHKKAKLCLYEQASHRPRVDWLKQLVSLVFEEKDIDATRYEVREMVWNGHELIDPSGHPQRTQPPAENSLSTLQPTHSSLLRCEETLSTSSSDELSDTETEVQESSQDSNPSYHHLQPLASRVWSMHPPAPESQDTLMADFDDEVEQDREFLAPLVSNHFPRGFSSLPSSSSSFALPLMASPNVAASPMRASFSNFGAANYQMNLNVGFTFSPSMLRRQSSNPSATATPLMQAHGIAMSPFLNENSLDQPAQPLASHSEARLGSIGFGWLNSRTESITNDTALFFEQHGGSALGGPTRGDSCLAQGTLSRINSGAEYFP
jgi:hypothetical protein